MPEVKRNGKRESSHVCRPITSEPVPSIYCLPIMRRRAIGIILVALPALGGIRCEAQTTRPCNVLKKPEAESILGIAVALKADDSNRCWFVQQAPAAGAATKSLSLRIWYSDKPAPDDLMNRRAQIAKWPPPSAAKDLTNFADGAIWVWTPGLGGTLYAFKGGTIEVEVIINGIAENAALQNAKTLASKPLGGLGGTGYAYLKTPRNGQGAAGGATSTATTQAAVLPPETSKNGIIYKPQEYWNGYHSEIIRQVFDGTYSRDVDSTWGFRLLFEGYVESFSSDCRAFLPARHEGVTSTQVHETVDRYGNVITRQEGESETIQVDSRFAPKYREYFSRSVRAPSEGLGGAIGVLSGRVTADDVLGPGLDAIKFFKMESCQGPAMRQMGENLLRASTGSPSLQQSEGERSLSPGRFTRFVDGCAAFFRAHPGKVREYGEYCGCLSEKYGRLMTVAEEAKYANDFEHLFWNGIAQPWARSDPAWPRLHPVVEQCAR